MIRAAAPEDWRTVREVRLAALADAPFAFGSTYERERGFTERDWRKRFAADSVTLVAWLDGQPVGIAGGIPTGDEDGGIDLVSMWVHPTARGRGLGEALVSAVARWAAQRDALALALWVTETNAPARRLYDRCGFVPTGERQPLPHDRSLTEIRMSRRFAGR